MLTGTSVGVPDPSELIATARLLLGAPGSAAPTQAQLRRAASTAYYAVFHKVLRAAAERFAGLGQEHSGAYAILYRSFDHGHMKQMCEALLKSTLPDALKWRLRRDAVSQETRDFAGSFPALQEIRHLADYDPTIVFLASDVSAACRLGRGGDRSIHPHPFE